jgi:cation diffusion facilitator family transporter
MYKVFNESGFYSCRDKILELAPRFEPEKNGEYFLIEDESGTIGFAEIYLENSKYFLKKIFITKEKRYVSHGKALLDHIYNFLADKNIDELYLDNACISDGNEKFFMKNKFTPSDEGYVARNLLEDKLRKNEGVSATVISILINIALAVMKIIFGILGKSRALMADGFHSFSDVIGSFVILISIYLGNKPADKDHPYGHEKIESIAGNMVGVVLIITATELINGSLSSLFSEIDHVKPKTITIFIAAISIVIKYFLYVYKYNIGKRLNNDAIIADAREHKSDVISSIGVVGGLILSIYVNPVFDIMFGIAVALLIGKEGIGIIIETSNKLLDQQDSKLISDLKKYILKYDKIENVHDVLTRSSGNKIFLSFHIRVDGSMSVYKAHELADDIKHSIQSDFKDIRSVIIHVDPIMG